MTDTFAVFDHADIPDDSAETTFVPGGNTVRSFTCLIQHGRVWQSYLSEQPYVKESFP